MSELHETPSTPRFGNLSIILMFIPILAVIFLSFIFEPIVNSFSDTFQRILMILTLFLPAMLGLIFAITGLVKKEPKKWIHVIGMILNLLESLYFGLLVLIAG